MAKIKLCLTAILGTELDMLLTAFVLHPQLVICRRTDNIARTVLIGNVINMT